MADTKRDYYEVLGVGKDADIAALGFADGQSCFVEQELPTL